MSIEAVDIAVIGTGPAGLAASLALAAIECDVTLIGPAFDPERALADQRTTALIGPSVDFLEAVGVWERCAQAAEPMVAVRIADNREGLLTSPEILFRAGELGRESFGANIPNGALMHAFHGAAASTPRIGRVPSGVARLIPLADRVRIELADGGAVNAHLVVAADGRASLAPAAAGIAVRTWNYPQEAVAANFAHTRPHGGIVNELHRRGGPLTTVPLPGNRSSLVWVEEADEARRLGALEDAAFGSLLEERLQGVLGAIGSVGPRALHPLSGLSAACMAASRIALVGETAHVVPPIGAQGLNIGLRDAAVLADCVADGRETGADPGRANILEAYDAARRGDVQSRSFAIDLLNRSLLTDFLPVDILRGIGARAVGGFAPLRRLLMREGMGLSRSLPRLMRQRATQRNP